MTSERDAFRRRYVIRTASAQQFFTVDNRAGCVLDTMPPRMEISLFSLDQPVANGTLAG